MRETSGVRSSEGDGRMEEGAVADGRWLSRRLSLENAAGRSIAIGQRGII